MLQVDNKIVSVDLLRKHFCCDLSACRGVCCVYGSSGAPLEREEESTLRQALPGIAPYLTGKGRAAIAAQGVAVVDGDGDLVTPLVPGSEECAYASFTAQGLCLCAIEQAFLEGKTAFRKPISCHLYPIRLRPLGSNTALSYDCWGICQPARSKGEQEQLPVFRFLKEPLTRRFGAAFYAQLEQVHAALGRGGF